MSRRWWSSSRALTASILDTLTKVMMLPRHALSTIALEDLPRLPEDQITALRQACLDGTGPVRVISAFALSPEARSKLATALSDVAGRTITCDFGQNDELITGLRLSVGPWVLRCSLADDLIFFAQTGGRAS